MAIFVSISGSRLQDKDSHTQGWPTRESGESCPILCIEKAAPQLLHSSLNSCYLRRPLPTGCNNAALCNHLVTVFPLAIRSLATLFGPRSSTHLSFSTTNYTWEFGCRGQ